MTADTPAYEPDPDGIQIDARLVRKVAPPAPPSPEKVAADISLALSHLAEARIALHRAEYVTERAEQHHPGVKEAARAVDAAEADLGDRLEALSPGAEAVES